MARVDLDAMLSSATRRDPAPAIVTPVDEAAPTMTKAKPKKAPPQRLVAPALDSAVRGSEQSPAVKGISVRLPKSLADDAEAYKNMAGISYPILIMLAVQEMYPQLRDLLADRNVQIGDGRGANLFALPTAVRRSQPAIEPRVMRPIKVSRERRDTLEAIAKELEAPSVNELVVTALAAYLEHVRGR